LKPRILIVVGLLILLACGAAYATPFGCRIVGGRWGQAEGLAGLCTTRLCYYFGNCGHWASPSLRCSAVKRGDPLSKVVFELGEPDVALPGRLSWRAAKAGSGEIVAEFANGRLTSIGCNKGE
jgi:hypothetical protein